MIYTKNLNGELLTTDTVSKVETHTYTLEFLTSQKIMLENELVEVNSLISEAGKAGVVLKIKDIIGI